MLSVIIPIYNEEKYIEIILDCLKNQTFNDFEVVLVDSSEDNTKTIAEKYKEFLDLRIINSDKKNVSYQRNLGVKNAKNENILFLDADTIFDNKFIESALNEIKDKDIKIAGSLLYPDSKKIVDRLFFYFFRIYMKALHKKVGLNGCCIFCLKSMHEKVNGFDENILVGEDFDYARKIKKFSEIHLLTSVNIKTSVRRFEKYGRLNTGVKILLIGLYTMFIGSVKKDIFNYRFNGWKK
ncbi:glycosyltransferase [Candidatus Woesearchaeota archaeon]|nr:glycosyltransferase [Candidatus Woesearchaeota archaeon]